MNDTEILQGQIRTVLALIAGALAAHGFLSDVAATEILGIATAIIPVAWSAYSKILARRRVALALNVGIVIADATIGPTPLASPEKAAALIKAVAPSIPAVIPAALSPMEVKT